MGIEFRCSLHPHYRGGRKGSGETEPKCQDCRRIKTISRIFGLNAEDRVWKVK